MAAAALPTALSASLSTLLSSSLSSSLSSFLAASVLLAVTPGPGVIYIVTRTLGQGRAAGLASVAGVAGGNALNAAAAACGLAAIFAVWSGAFLVVKYAGAAYLVWLGWRLWRSASVPERSAAVVGPAAVPLARLWRDGLVVAVLNPKTTLFFAAFLPQFMDTHRALLPQALGLGGAFVAIAALTDAVYALLASAIAPSLSRHTGAAGIGRRASGASLIGLGLLGALTGPAPAARGRL